jgi:hypothetical protein
MQLFTVELAYKCVTRYMTMVRTMVTQDDTPHQSFGVQGQMPGPNG